jgi:hypothetical protein
MNDFVVVIITISVDRCPSIIIIVQMMIGENPEAIRFTSDQKALGAILGLKSLIFSRS